MANKISALEVQTTRFDPLEAEVTITVVPESPAEDLTLRGRLTGPRSPYFETVEIAYALRPLPPADDALKARVIIPEANFWSPAKPFHYDGLVELCEGDQVLDRASFLHGLRHLHLSRKGLSLNGERLPLRGLTLAIPELGVEILQAEAPRWRAVGINLLLLPVTLQSADLWAAAERLGFFLLGELDGVDDELLWYAEERLSRRVSAFGWLLPQRLTREPQLWHNAMLHLQGSRRDILVGVRLEELPLGVLPGHVSFVLCKEQKATELGEIALSRLILARRGDSPDAAKIEAPATGTLGRVYRNAGAATDTDAACRE